MISLLLLVILLGLFPVPRGRAEKALAGAFPRVALTFDDGYGLDHRILEFLSSQGISATAFVVGSWAQQNPFLLREMNSLGWDICNHTQNHPELTRLPDSQIVAELNTCQAVISSITGQHLPFFRPPGGFIDDRVRAVAAAAGYTPVMWDLDSGDSRGMDFSVPDRIGYMVNAARDGNILLFHFGGKHTYELVTGVVRGLQQRGFCFVTVSELYGWKNIVRGGDSGPGVAEPSRRFYFAEGTTRPGFQEWILVFNPHRREVEIKLSFYASGEVLTREYSLPAQRRLSLNVNREFPGEEDVSVILEASEEVVAERTVFFNRGHGYSGGFIAPGEKEPRSRFYFPDGTAQEGFEEYLALFNPGPLEAAVELEMHGKEESRVERAKVPPQHRITVGLKDLAPAKEYSLEVKSSVPVVAERSRYFVYNHVVTGGSGIVGEELPRTEWFFAEGTTRNVFQSFLSVYNPCREPTWVRVYLAGTDGTEAEERFILPAKGRRTLFLNDYLPPEIDYASRVQSLLPVTAERSIYFHSRNVMGGSSSPGISAPAERWYFAEGCTAPGFSEWLVMENPWESEQEVQVIYYTENDTVERFYPIPPHGRITADVSSEVGGCREVSIEVRSFSGVVAERSLYFEADLGL